MKSRKIPLHPDDATGFFLGFAAAFLLLGKSNQILYQHSRKFEVPFRQKIIKTINYEA